MRKTLIHTLSLALICMGLAGAARADEYADGIAAFKAGNFSQAATLFQTYVEQRPDVFQGHYMLGQVLLKLNRNSEALNHLRKAYDLNPENPGIQLVLGKAYIDSRRYADAVGLMGKIDASKLPTAQQAALHQMLALAYTKTGQDGRALSELSQAVKLNSKDADLWFQYGTAAVTAGNLSTAAQALEKAAQLDPRDADKQRVFAQTMLKVGRSSTGAAKTSAYNKAVGAAKTLVASSASFDNLMLLGDAQLGAKDYDGSISSYQQAGSKDSSAWLPPYYLGQAYTVKEQYNSAEASLKQALNKASSSADQKTIWKQLGFVYEKKKDYTQAAAAYQRAGDSAGIARVEENRKTAEYNKKVEAEEAEIRRLQEEQERIKAQLKDLPGAGPPR